MLNEVILLCQVRAVRSIVAYSTLNYGQVMLTRSLGWLWLCVCRLESVTVRSRLLWHLCYPGVATVNSLFARDIFGGSEGNNRKRRLHSKQIGLIPLTTVLPRIGISDTLQTPMGHSTGMRSLSLHEIDTKQASDL